MLTRRVATNFLKNAVRRYHGEPDGIPGANLPFSITNKYMVTGMFVVFFGSGFAAPFIVVRHQMLK